MAKARDETGLTIGTHSRFLMRILAFLIIVGLVAYVLIDELQRNFLSNPVLNGLILGVLAIGILFAFRQILVLRPAAKWVNAVRRLDRGLLPPVEKPPGIVAPMAPLLERDWGQVSLAALAMRSILDSVGARLEEGRELSRYLTGLLVFLGLLGTFWGLLQTIAAVADTVGSIAPDGDNAAAVSQLISGISGPLAGMATAFSSSLFGLTGSLILGFLDLQASQAQNQFYNDLEEWLAEATEVTARVDVPGTRLSGVEGLAPSLAAGSAGASPALVSAIRDLRADVQELSATLKHVTQMTGDNQTPRRK